MTATVSAAPNYARRYTFRVPAASRVSVDAASVDVDTYLYVLHGNGSAAEVLGSDNDGHTAGRTDSRVADVRVLPGLTYVVEVTSKPPRQTGPYALTVTTAADLPAVKITGLVPVSLIRNGTHTLSSGFTVEPATAECTTQAPASVSPQTGANRTVSRQVSGSSQVTVVVTCSNDGNSDGIGRTQFSLAQAVSSVTAEALSGGSCTASTKSLPTGVDARYACNVNESVTLKVSAESRGAHNTPVIRWVAGSDGDVTVTVESAGTPKKVSQDTTPLVYTRTGSARVTCTDDGTVTVTVTAGVDTYTVQLDITCGPHPAAHCVDDIGELGEGVTTRSGTIKADAACTSLRNAPRDRRTWYARRHTFSLDAPTTITFVLEGVPAARPSLNVALLLLSGDAPDGSGARLHFNNNDNSNLAASRLNSRLTDIALPKGTYTVEATTWHPWRTGRYTLSIIAPALRDTVSVTSLSGGSCRPSGKNPPTGIDDLWECMVQPEGRLRVLATARSGATSFSHAWTVADGVTIPDEPGNPKILPRQGPDELDTGWRQSSRIALECTADGTADLIVGFGTGSTARTRKARLDLDCSTPVQINGLEDVTENGTTGQALTVTAPFTVEPTTAECTPTSTVGTPRVTKPAGGDPDDRVVSMSLTVESSATVTVTCTATGRPDGVAKTTLRAHQPFALTVSGDACAAVPASVPLSYRCALSDEHQVTLGVSAAANARDIRLSWAASGSASVVSSRRDAVSQIEDPAGVSPFAWLRTGAVTAECTANGTVTVTATAGTGDAQITRTAPVSIDCQDQGSITGLVDTSAAGTGTVPVSRRFAVAPADAPCKVTSTAGTATVDTVLGGSAGDRVVSVALAVAQGADASATLTVDCTPPGHAPVIARATFTAAFGDPCDDPLGDLTNGTVRRSGEITRDGRCVSAQGGQFFDLPDQYTRRHTFTLDRSAEMQIWMNSSASNPSTLDTYVLLLRGHGTNGEVIARDDNDGPRTTNSRISRQTFGPGRYTIEATTSLPGHTGIYDLIVSARLAANITGLHGVATYGIGTVTVTDDFTVDLAHIPCDTPAGTTGTISPASGAERTLTVKVKAGTTATATVVCDEYFRPEASVTAQYEVRHTVESLSVQAVSGGVCWDFTGTLDAGVDAKYTCKMTRDDTLTLGATATGPSARTVLGWARNGGLRVIPALADDDVSVAGGKVVFSQDGTAAVTCTANGDVTVTGRVGAVVGRTVVVSVTCEPPVQIANYVPGTRNGAGEMTGTFDVTPAGAKCMPRHVGGIAVSAGPTVSATGTRRSVSVSTSGTGRVDIRVRCNLKGYGAAAAKATFTAHDGAACLSPLGVLRHGTRTFTGSLSATSCTSVRRPGSSDRIVHYAHRYSFTLASAGWVSVGLEPTGTGTDALDTYLLLLDGHGSGGAVLESHNNLRGDATELDEVYLAAGDYTVEATTALSNATGGYRIAIEGDFAAQSGELPATVTAAVGLTAKHRFDYLPQDATVSVQSVSPVGLSASVTAVHGSAAVELTPDKARTTTVTLAFTASGHTSTQQLTVLSHCQSGYRASPDGTCQPLTPLLDESCQATLAGGRTWGKRLGATVTLERLFGGACTSVSVPGRKATYQTFDVPTSVTSRSEAGYDVTIEVEVTHDALLYAGLDTTSNRPRLPGLHVVLWKAGGNDGAGILQPMTPDARADRSRARFTASLTAGSYVVEVAPVYATSAEAARDTTIGDRFAVNVVLPSIQQSLDDVHYLGNIRSNNEGASLDAFLDARGTLRYGASPVNPTNDDDLFDPESPGYPWLSFSVDRCRIPEGFVAGADAVIDEIMDALLLDYWGRLFSEPDDTTWTDAVQSQWFRDYPDFGGAEVAFVYACMRHDFNWKNLDLVSWFYNHGPDSTTSNLPLALFLALESNTRMHSDLEILCHANRVTSIETSVHFDWEIGSDDHLEDCLRTAMFIRKALDVVPPWIRPYDWGPYDSR